MTFKIRHKAGISIPAFLCFFISPDRIKLKGFIADHFISRVAFMGDKTLAFPIYEETEEGKEGLGVRASS